MKGKLREEGRGREEGGKEGKAVREGESISTHGINSIKKTQESEIRNNEMDLFRIEKSDKSSLKWFNLSSGLKVKKKPRMQRIFGTERTTHGKAKVRKSVVWLEPQEQG